MHHVVVDLMYGDSGKGHLTDALCRIHSAKLVVRYNGGPQAAHNVVTPEGKHHCFSQFGSGTFAGAKTHLSRFMLIEPWALLNEAESIGHHVLDGLTIDEDCPIITPYHWCLNRMREAARGDKRHGSCGMGVGELRADMKARGPVIKVEDIVADNILFKARAIKEAHLDEAKELSKSCEEAMRWYTEYISESETALVLKYEEFRKLVKIVPAKYLDGELKTGTVIFEGAQGVLLDEWCGFAPYNTWTNTTFTHADELLRNHPEDEVEYIGVLRAYATRHGAGPFVTEDKTMKPCPGEHNTTGPWQGKFRIGHFDGVAARYALNCAGRIDALAVTHLDRFEKEDFHFALAYHLDGSIKADLDVFSSFPAETGAQKLFAATPIYGRLPEGHTAEDIPTIISALTDKPIAYESWGPTAADVVPIEEGSAYDFWCERAKQ